MNSFVPSPVAGPEQPWARRKRGPRVWAGPEARAGNETGDERGHPRRDLAAWLAMPGIVVALPASPRLRWSRLQPATGGFSPAPASARPVLPAAEDAPVIITPYGECSAPLAGLGLRGLVRGFLYRMAQIVRSSFIWPPRSAEPRPPGRGSRRTSGRRPCCSLAKSPRDGRGFLHPVVILPASLESEITEQERQYALLHEYARSGAPQRFVGAGRSSHGRGAGASSRRLVDSAPDRRRA